MQLARDMVSTRNASEASFYGHASDIDCGTNGDMANLEDKSLHQKNHALDDGGNASLSS